MLDFLRDRGSTAEEKQLEALSAYLDNILTPAERKRFERQLAHDGELRAEMERMRLLKLQLRSLPRRRVPRSFALDPALYGRPKAQPMMQLYPMLCGATALAALVFVFTVALGAFGGLSSGAGSPAPAAEIMMSKAAEEEAAPAEAFSMAEAAPPMATSEVAGNERTRPTFAAESPQPAQEPPSNTLPAELTAPIEGTASASDNLSVSGVPEEDIVPGQGATMAPVITGEVATSDTTVEQAKLPGETGAVDYLPAISSFIGPIQIVAGIVFLVFLFLWAAARRKTRGF